MITNFNLFESKIENENVLYHSTNHTWTKPEIHGLGFHAGTLKAAKDRMKSFQMKINPHIIQLKMNLKNPLYIGRDYRFHNDLTKVSNELYKDGIINKDEKYNFSRVYSDEATFSNLRKLLHDKYGYDGIIYKNNIEDRGSESYIAFYPEQIEILDYDFKEPLSEKYVHYINVKDNSIVDPLVDFKGHLEENKKNVEYINKYLRSRGKSRFMPNSLIKLYHGTSPKIQILDDGIKTTKMSTSHSYQSTLGYTYFSIYPSMAKTFGNMGFGISDSVVYECLIPICEIEPDKDQLRNVRLYSDRIPGDTLGDSIIYGHGVRVKGDIPPYMISKTDF